MLGEDLENGGRDCFLYLLECSQSELQSQTFLVIWSGGDEDI